MNELELLSKALDMTQSVLGRCSESEKKVLRHGAGIISKTGIEQLELAIEILSGEVSHESAYGRVNSTINAAYTALQIAHKEINHK